MKKRFILYCALLSATAVFAQRAPLYQMPYVPELHDKAELTPASAEHAGAVTFASRTLDEVGEAQLKQVENEDKKQLVGTDGLLQKRTRVGIERKIEPGISVDGFALSDGEWSFLPNGTAVWAVIVDSPNALGIKFMLENVQLPAGATVRTYDSLNPSSNAGPYDTACIHPDGSLCSKTIFSPSATLEVVVPALQVSEVKLEFNVIRHVYRGFITPYSDLIPFIPLPNTTGNILSACMEDWQCYNGDPGDHPSENWFNEGQAVAMISDGLFRGSGNLIEDTDPTTVRPLFVTAAHVVQTPGLAANLEFFWFFNSGDCDGQNIPTQSQDTDAGSPVIHTDGGAGLLFTTGFNPTAPSFDFTLLNLITPPPPGASFVRWNIDVNNPTSPASGSTRIVGERVVGIGHPQGNFKHIHAGVVETAGARLNRSDLDTFYVQINTPFIKTTSSNTDALGGFPMPGNSGGPVFDIQGNYMGPLSLGTDMDDCSDQQPTGGPLGIGPLFLYSRFDAMMALPAVQAILDPGGTGGGGSGGTPLPSSNVFVNEFSYDVAGNDNISITAPNGSSVRVEGFELGARHGTPLDEFDIYFFDQNGVQIGQMQPLGRVIVSNPTGVCPDPGTSPMGLLWFDMPVVANDLTGMGFLPNGGAFGGGALGIVRRADEFVSQFISWETGGNGITISTNSTTPLAGLTSAELTDTAAVPPIAQDGVIGPSQTPAGFTLQQSGSGINASDFVFNAPMPQTPGTLNNATIFFPIGRFISQEFGCATNPTPSVLPLLPPSPIPDLVTVQVGSSVVIPLSGTDPLGELVALSPVHDLPAHMDFTPTTPGRAVLTFNPDLSQWGQTYVVTVSGTDSGGATTNATITFNVEFDPLSDEDGDGILDIWEFENCRGTRSYCHDIPIWGTGIPDLDGDGLSDVQEWVADMLPTDPASGVEIFPTVENGRNVLKFLASKARKYKVQYKDGIEGSWIPLPEFADSQYGAPDNDEHRGLQTVVDADATGFRIYRYRVHIPGSDF